MLTRMHAGRPRKDHVSFEGGSRMDDSAWVKPAVIGAAVGATVGVMLFAAIGFTTGGWMTTGGADKVYLAVAHETMIAAMVPVCLDLSANDPDRQAKLAVIRDTPAEGRREAIMSSGWATVPGSERPSHDLAQACMNALEMQQAK
jgi:hypothetical protein